MFILSVLPLTKSFGKGEHAPEALSYFSSSKYEPGEIVRIPLRSKAVRALVIEAKDASSARMEARSADFSMKKVLGPAGKGRVPKAFMRAAKEFALFEAQSLASTLSVLLPEAIVEHAKQLPAGAPSCTILSDVSAFQGTHEERVSLYRSLIRESFARKRSFFLLVPTAEDARSMCAELSRGIEEFSACFHGGMNKKEIAKALAAALDPQHPALIVATAPFLSLLREDTEVFALDRENSRAYRTLARPHLDFRVFARILAKEYCTRLLLGSDLLSVETIVNVREGTWHSWGHMKMRAPAEPPTEVVSMIKNDASEPFKIFSDGLAEEIRTADENGRTIFLFGARKGLSPTMICADCEEAVACNACGAPLVLHTRRTPDGEEKRMFQCHKCGERRSAEDACPHCGSWRITLLGIGAEMIEKEARKLTSGRVWLLDKETASSPAKAQAIAEEFARAKSGVLVGTERSLLYIKKPADISAVVSADSFLGIPDFRMNERIMSILMRVRALGRARAIFQTRSKDETLFRQAAEGNYLLFFQKEIEDRKHFSFPPFSLFIKIVWEDAPARAAESAKLLEEKLGDRVEIMKVRSGARRARYHGLIKIDDPASWPDAALAKTLISLPPQFAVMVDPDGLL